MTAEDLKAWVKDNLERKMREFGLPHWRISVVWARLDATDDGFQSCMSVRKRFEYERATITIDATACVDLCDDLAEFEKDIEHELMHIVHSPFDLLPGIVADLPQDQVAAFNEAWRVAQEMTVRNMERMTHGIREAAKGGEN